MKKIVTFFLFLFYCNAYAYDWVDLDVRKLDYFNGIKVAIRYPDGWKIQRNYGADSMIQFYQVSGKSIEMLTLGADKLDGKFSLNKKNHVQVAQFFAKKKNTIAKNIQFTSLENLPAVVFDTETKEKRLDTILYLVTRNLVLFRSKDAIYMAYASGATNRDEAYKHFDERTAYIFFNSLTIINN